MPLVVQSIPLAVVWHVRPNAGETAIKVVLRGAVRLTVLSVVTRASATTTATLVPAA